MEGPFSTTPKEGDSQLVNHVEEVHLTYETQDITSHILGGWLQLLACLKPVCIAWYRLSESLDLYDWHLILDHDRRSYLAITLDVPPLSRTFFDEGNRHNRLFCIHTKKLIRRSTCSACGLLLRVVDFDNGTFKRLGYVCGVVTQNCRQL
jgi:hypothetical protein